MRLDKFLKVSRLIKRRTVAKELADQGRVTVNGNTAKAGTEVNVGDTLEIKYGQKLMTVKVARLEDHATKESAPELFEVIGDEPIK